MEDHLTDHLNKQKTSLVRLGYHYRLYFLAVFCMHLQLFVSVIFLYNFPSGLHNLDEPASFFLYHAVVHLDC